MTRQEILVRNVLLDALAADWDVALNMAAETPLSRRQRRRMAAMTADPWGYLRRFSRPMWKKIAQTAAAVLLAASVTLGGLLAASPTVRAAVARWFAEVYESQILYRFSGETTADALPHYTIAALPEGYVLTDEVVEFPGYEKTTYQTVDGQTIHLTCSKMQQGSAVSIDTDDMDVRDVTVSGHRGQVYISLKEETSNGIIWMDDTRAICFTVDGFFTENELLHMAESVSLED